MTLETIRWHSNTWPLQYNRAAWR